MLCADGTLLEFNILKGFSVGLARRRAHHFQESDSNSLNMFLLSRFGRGSVLERFSFGRGLGFMGPTKPYPGRRFPCLSLFFGIGGLRDQRFHIGSQIEDHRRGGFR